MDEEHTTDRPRRIGAVKKCCNILNYIHREGGATLTEVANALDLTPGTVYPHLMTLMEEERVVKKNEQYHPGYLFLTIGEKRRREDVLYKHSKSEIKDFAEENNIRMQIYVEEFGWGVCIEIAGGKRSISPPDNKGQRTPLHCIAAGKAILAELSDEKVNELIELRGLTQVTENTISNRDKLFEELDQISNQEYAINDEEYIPRLRAVGAAITKEDGTVLGAISASAPKGVLGDSRFTNELPQKIVSSANTIEMNIRVENG